MRKLVSRRILVKNYKIVKIFAEIYKTLVKIWLRFFRFCLIV